MMVPIPMPTESFYRDDLASAAQRLVNVYPEANSKESGQPFVLKGIPGLSRVADAATGGQVQAMVLQRDGSVIFSSNGRLCRWDGTTVTFLGTIDLDNATTLATDGISCIVVANSRAWLYNQSVPSFGEITADMPYSPSSIAWIEGYFVATAAGGGQIFMVSNLNAANVWDALDFATAQGSAGDILRVIETHLDLWIFSRDHAEIWTLSGASDFPLQRVTGGVIEYGTASAKSVATCDNSIFWLGHDRKVYRANGYTPAVISTAPLEFWLEANSVTDAIGFETTTGGHTCYVLVFPTANATWAYDVTTQKWSEWSSDAAGNGRWRGNCAVRTNDQQYIGDSANGYIFLFNESFNTDDTAPIYWEVQFAPIDGGGPNVPGPAQFPSPFGSGRRLFMARLFLDFVEVGNSFTLAWSKDDGATFPGSRTMVTALQRTFATRLGSFRRMVLRLSGARTSPLTLMDAQADIDGGAS